MRKRSVLHLLLPLLLSAGMWAQSVPPASTARGNWPAVEELAPGTAISVTTRHRIQCVFREATETELVCDVSGMPMRMFPPAPAFVFRRDLVRQVRLEHRLASVAVGAAAGATIGAVAGANTGNGSLTHQGGELVLGGIGALVGATFGRTFCFLHGKIIYER
jgi:hypothetical protein